MSPTKFVGPWQSVLMLAAISTAVQKKMKSNKIFCVISLLFFSIIAYAQKPSDLKESESVRLWKMRSEFTTNDIVKDISTLSHQDKVLYYGRLSKIWWNKDIVEGKFWLGKSVDIVLSPATDFKNDKEKLEAIRYLLGLVAAKDEILTKKLIKKLSDLTENSTQEEIKNNGEALTETAVSLVNTDPQKAFNLGLSAIKLQKPIFSIFLFWKLSEKNSLLADNYFQAGIAKAKVEIDGTFWLRLKSTAFPEIKFADFAKNPKPKPNDLLRKSFLNILVDNFKFETDALLEKKVSNCSNYFLLRNNLADFINTLIPEKLPTLNYVQEVCEKTRSQSQNDFIKNQNSLKTIEDFLSAADKTDDIQQKDNYRFSATQLAINLKNFKQAIDILASISEKEKENHDGVWEKFHRESWEGYILQLFDNNEITAVYDELKKSPDYMRPSLYLSVSQKCDAQNNKQIGYDFLNEASQGLRKKDFEPYQDNRILFESPVILMTVTLGYTKLGYHNEAIDSFSDAINGLNKFVSKIPAEERREKILQLPILWGSYTNFPEPFFTTYFQQISDNISKFESALIRAKFRLNVLRFCLKKQVEVEKKDQQQKEKQK
jgi:hypothetical protein